MLYSFDIMKNMLFLMKNHVFLLSILTIILVATIFFIVNYYFNDVRFLTKKEVCELLTKDLDNYYETFNENDFLVRKVRNENEYIEKFSNSCSEFTMQEKKIINECTKVVRKRLRESSGVLGKGFDSLKASKMPIVFGCMKGYDYENGFPHTRFPAIILYHQQLSGISMKSLEKIIVHEMMHLYQKMYPRDLDVYLNQNNFELVKRRNGYDNIRANPDTDEYVYRNNNTNQTYQYIYKPFPVSIGDVIRTDQEHPFEEMAYNMESIVE